MKKHLLFLTLLSSIFCSTNTSAQTTGYLSFPDPSNQNYFTRMIHTSDGGFISVGSSGSAGVNHDITKWDANFHVQWYQNFLSPIVSNWNNVIETNDGNFIAMGANANHTGCNIVFKISSTGTLLWQKEYYISGNFLTSFALSKAAGNDPGFVFGGGACAGSNFLVRCDANGNIVWQQEYYILGGSGVETILCINAEADHYILSGYVGFNSDIDAYIMKIDSSNALLWCNVVNEPIRPQVPFKTIKLASGNYVMLCGYNSNPNYSQLLYYFNGSNGSVTNAIKITSPTMEEINFGGLVEVSNGKVMLNGSINASPMSYIWMELDAFGGILWQKKGVGVTSGFLNGSGYTIAKTSNNLYALGGGAYTDGKTVAVVDSTGAGFCNSVAASVSSVAAETYTNTVTTPIILTVNILSVATTNTSSPLTVTQSTLCGTLGLDESSAIASSLNVFPNPSADEITIDFGTTAFTKADVTFYNMLGEKVNALSLSADNTSVDISTLPCGIYMMEIIVNGERILRRVLKA